MSDSAAAVSLRFLSDYLGRCYGKNVIILLDEYDTPMQEAYVNGYWEEMVAFINSLFNFAFKVTNSIGIDDLRAHQCASSFYLNNLEVVTTTSDKYAPYFGFLEEEVYGALEEYGLSGQKEEVKCWYDGFTFGNFTDIYNPWSILNFLDKRVVDKY